MPHERSGDPLGELNRRKGALRRQLTAARIGRSAAQRAVAGLALAAALPAVAEVRAARTLAAFVGIGTEPPTLAAVRALAGSGVHVLLPVLLTDCVLDWAGYDPEAGLRPASRGLLEPTGPRLGPAAVAETDAVVVPALAVDMAGRRLGRGGGCYDRTLARLPNRAPVLAVVYDDEVLAAVPVGAHDRLVTAAVTPRRVLRFSPNDGWTGEPVRQLDDGTTESQPWPGPPTERR